MLHHKKNKPEDYCNIPPASTVDIPSRWDPQGRAVQVLLSAQKKKRHTNVCSPVDIPTGWEPRTEQQPTGLIAHPAAQGRAVQVLLSAQKKEKTYERMSFLGAVKQSKSEPFSFDAA